MNESRNISQVSPTSMLETKRILGTALDELARLPNDCDALPVPESLIFARTLLDNTNHDIVVCGEARQGKSSFINALLGTDILPVDVVVTTSQVFRISHSNEESYFLVFEDGLRLEIAKGDLAKYGKQSDENLADEPVFSGRVLKWIEVNTPAAKLPAGLHLLDTPGLGALYARHAEIALRHIENADAVIFVKSVDAPLKGSELDMLDTIFAVTQNVLFVLSKKDQLYADETQALAERNEKILNERFGSQQHRVFRFWPISNHERMEAFKAMAEAEQSSETVDGSGFPELLDAMSNLFERTTGLTCSQIAYAEASSYYNRCAQFQKERMAVLSAGPSSDAESVLKEKQAKMAEFNSKWGAQGSKRGDFQKRILRVVGRAQTLFSNVFPDVQREFSNRVFRLDSDKDFADMSKSLPDDISREVQNRLTGITRAVAGEFQAISSDLSKEMALDVPAVAASAGEIDTGSGLSRIGAGLSGALSAAWKTSLVLGVAGLAGVSVQTVVAAALSFTGPVGWCIAGILVWSAKTAWKNKVRQQHAQARQQLNKAVGDIVGELRTKMFIGVDMETPPIKKWLQEAQCRAESAVKEMAEAELKEMQDGIQRLEEDARAVEDQRKRLKENMGKLADALKDVQPRLLSVRGFLQAYVQDQAHSI